MQISEVLNTLRAEIILERTPSGRPVTEYAKEAIMSALNDEKNWNFNAVICSNCCIIQSSLLTPSGCANCGSKDLRDNINKTEIL